MSAVLETRHRIRWGIRVTHHWRGETIDPFLAGREHHPEFRRDRRRPEVPEILTFDTRADAREACKRIRHGKPGDEWWWAATPVRVRVTFTELETP